MQGVEARKTSMAPVRDEDGWLTTYAYSVGDVKVMFWNKFGLCVPMG